MSIYENCVLLNEDGTESPITNVEKNSCGAVCKIFVRNQWMEWSIEDIFIQGISDNINSINLSDDIDELLGNIDSLYGTENADEWIGRSFDEMNLQDVKELLIAQTKADYNMNREWRETDAQREKKLVNAYRKAFGL
jgi:hypothetical protein